MRSRSSRREANAHEAHLLPPPCVDGYQKERKALCALSSLLRVHGSDAVCHCVPRRHPRALYGQWQGERLRHLCGRDDDEPRLVRRIGVHRAVSLLHEQLSPASPQEGIRPLQRARHGPRRTQRHSLLGDTSGRGVHADHGAWPRPAALLCLAVRTAADFISPRRGVHREPCRHQAVRHHVHRHLRAALCARCAVAAPRTGRGAFEERKRRRKAAEVAMAARHPRPCAAARRVLHRRDHQRPRTGDAALLPRGHHGHSIDVSSLHLRQRDALQNTPEG